MSVLLRALLGLAVVVGCEEVLVSPVPVATVQVVPDSAQLFVGEQVKLRAELRDDTGEEVAGRPITWRSGDTRMATVDTSGAVAAVGAGTTEVTATAEGQTGAASIVVLRRPRIELDRGSVAFSAVAGSGDPQPVEVGVTNGGDGTLAALALAVAYGDTVGGWLDAALDSTGAPTRMTLAARTAGLAPGPYAATVSVTDPAAENSPADLEVTFQVQQSIPVAPSALAADVSADSVVLTWTDNSDIETELRIERWGPADASFVLLATLGADATTYADTAVALDSRYRYRVRACNVSGCSAFSDALDATTPPVAPADLAVASVTIERVELTWTDASATETRFEVERNVGGGTFTALTDVPADTGAYADTAVVEDTEYAYRVRACNADGCSVYSAEATTPTPPTAPSDLVATAASDTAIDLTWSDNSATETGFRIERSTDGGTTFTELVTVAAGTTSHTDAGLDPNTSYAYRVRACNASGCSAPTATATTSTSAIPAPSGLTATIVSIGQIDLAWNDNSATETAFRVERSTDGGTTFDSLATVGADATSYSDATTQGDATYVYRVAACDDSGCASFSNQVVATTRPTAPSGLAITSVAAGRIDLAWTDNAATETRFEVERSAGGGAFMALPAAPADAESYTDATAAEDTEYAYQVRACNAGGCSSYTPEVAVTTPPSAPSGLTAAATSDTAIALGWTDNSGTETGFRIERRIDGSTTFTELTTVAAGTTSYSDTGLTPATTYAYRILACNASGCSAPTSSAAATTSSIPAPSSLTATVVSAGRIDLGWTDNTTNETGFRIERSTDAGATFDTLATVGADVTAYSDTSTAEDTRYTYRVTACSGSSCSPFSNQVTRTTPPSSASGLTATAASDTEIDLTWTDNSAYETELRIQRSTDGGATFSALVTLAANSTSYTDDGLDPATTYAYRVLACNASGCADPSAAASATTRAIPAPSALAATVVSAGRIDLTWADNSTTETQFQVERSTDGGATFAALVTLGEDATTYTDDATAEDTEYLYRVAACNAGGCSAWSGTAAAITPPSAASGLGATVVSATQIDLAWTDNSGTETGFRVERAAGGGSFIELATVGPDVTTYADNTTSADSEYAYRVVACNGSGCAAPSNIASTPTPPTVPGGLNATAASDTRIDLDWTDNSATESSFRIERRTGTDAFVQIATTGADVTSYTSTGLSPSTAYDFRIRACNAGGCSAYSATATVTTLATPPPADPSNLTATLAGDQSSTSLSWTDNATDEDEYRIQRSVDGGTYTIRATLGANATAFTDTDMAVDDRYTYRVEACSTAGCSGFSNEASVVTQPVAPSGLAAAVVSADRIDLSWTDQSDTEAVFRIERSVDGGAFAVLDSVPTDSGAFSDLTTAEDTEYAYRVRACNGTGCSAFSAQATATTPPTAASGLTATAVSDTEIDLSWTDNSDTETEFQIQRRFGTTPGGYSTIDTLDAGTTSYTDGGLTAETTYEYRIVACNASGCADPSTAATATTQPIPIPSAPSGLSANAVSVNQIDLSWTDNAANEDQFSLERSTDGGTSYTVLTTIGVDATSYSDLTLTEDNEYTYRLTACNASGCSPYSNAATDTTPPSAASAPTATATSDTEITVEWTDNSIFETEFRIERSPAGANAFAQVGTVGTDVVSFDDTGLDPSTAYDYRIAACNPSGCAAPSAVASATTQAIPAPSGLNASVVSAGRVDLTWTDNSTSEDEFRVERSTDGGTTWAGLETVAASATSYSDATTSADAQYSYRVRACDAFSCSAWSGTVTVTTPPSAPSGLAVTSATVSQIDLGWTDNSTFETRFEVERSDDGGAFAALTPAGADATSYSDGGVTEDTDYGYRVRACNASGCSDWTGPVTTPTPPTAASGLAASPASDTEISLTWTDASSTETEFRVERRTGAATFSQIASVGAGVTDYADSGLQPATTYDYRVITCNTSGCADPSATASATTQQIPAPAAPSGLAATVVSTGRIDLAWTDNATTEASYRVERSTDGGATYDTLTVLAADAVAHSDQTTAEDTEYTYRVAACNAGGCSFSNTTTGTTPPSAASGLGTTVVSATQIDLAWTDNSGTETEFRIQRSISGGSFLPLDVVGADVSTYSDATTAADTEYAYRVVACNASGCAAASNIASTFTPPTAPGGLAATAASDTRIDLSWTDNSATESSFQIERRTGTDEFSQVAITGANATSYPSTGLSPSTAYDFRIRACNVGGCSAYSDTVTATTLATPPPADPSNLTATLAGDQSSTGLSWTDNATDEDNYRVQRSVDGGSFTVRATLGANTTTFNDTDMSVDDRYTYRVEACSAAGCSGFSNEASVVTEPVPASGLTVTVVSTGRVDLGWVDESDTEDVFRIERSTDGVNFAVLDSVPTDGTAFSDLTTVEDTEYTYRIQACNTTGCAAYSAAASDTTPPSPASGLSATATSDTSIDLGWTDNSTYETGFRIQRRITGTYVDIDTVAADVSTFTDTGLVPATTYQYRILACNGSGCADASTAATATTDSIPAPTGLGATAVAAGQVDLAWTDNATTESEFRIERSADGGTTWTSLATVGADVESDSDLTTVEDTEYTYRVRACDAASCSGWSNEATAITPPSAASGLTATATSDTTIDLGWADNSTYETEFRIERSTDGGTTFVDHDTVAADLTAYTDAGLAPNTAYAYQILACNASGCAAPSPSTSATTDPIPAPSSLTSTVISANRIDLAWTDNSATETRFQVERSTNGGTSFDSIASTAADATGYSDGSTVADTEYLYRVAACNADGCSDFSNTVTDTTPPAAASGVTVDAVSDSTVTLSWTDASGIETGFRIERRTGTNAFAEVGTTAADVITFTDGTVAPATSYDYRVLTCNGTECVVSADTASATTDPIPAPTGLAATVAAETTVDLTWADNSTTETRFQIERSTNGGTSFDSIDSTLADATAYTDTTTVADTEYLYRVAACNADGCSARSGEVTVATTPAPASGVGVATVSSSELTVTWADNSTTETVFRIERRTGTDAFAEVGTAAADATSFDDSGLSPATTYDYRVLACNGADCAAPSASASGTTADVVPSAPSGLTAVTDTTGGTVVIDLGWTDTSDNEDEFRIERGSGGAFTPLDTVPAETVTLGDAAVDPDSTYDYRVQACNTAGCSAFTATATASTPPSAPSGLTALTVSDTGIDLSWTDNSGVETTFEIERRTGTNTFTQVTTVNTDVVTYPDTGLTASTTYDYRIRACNAAGCSAYTAIASATTNAAP